MARSIRMTVFLNQEEHHLLKAVTPPDASVGATVRRMALDKAKWLASKGLKKDITKPALQEDTVPWEEGPPTDDGPEFEPVNFG